MAAFACQQRAWQRHRAELRAFLADRSGSPASADDLLQEVFLKAIAQGQAFCRIDNPRAWLFRVARNLLIDRQRLAHDALPLPDELGAPPPADVDAVDLLSHCLPRVLAELPAADREAITLCDIEGLSQQDYARRLQLSLPAAKSRVQRARRRLREQLANACQLRFDENGKVCCFVARPPLAAGDD